VVLLADGAVSFAGPPTELDQNQLVEHYLGAERPV
jgi:hypothetical protein